MVSILVKHTVEDYKEWKPHFDEDGSSREEHGEHGYRLFHVAEDPDEIVILFEWDSKEHAEEFLESPSLREVMEEAGVVGEPEIYFLNEIESKQRETPAT